MVANRVAVRRYGEQNPAYEPARPHHSPSPAGRLSGATYSRCSSPR